MGKNTPNQSGDTHNQRLKVEEKQWYILQHILTSSSALRDTAAQAVQKFNHHTGNNLEIFAPTITKMTVRRGKIQQRHAPFTYQYLFVRGTLEAVKQLCDYTRRFVFLLNRSADRQRYATLTDQQMQMFRIIAAGYSNSLPFLSLDDIDLEEGDKVEIVEGAFPGLVGYYIPHPKSKSGDIMLAVSQNLGTVVYDIPAKYVRILEFSKTSRRGYDQIDAFVPRLFAALRHHHAGLPLTPAMLSHLHLFTRRMATAKIPNPKIDAKLQALLAAAFTLLATPASAPAPAPAPAPADADKQGPASRSCSRQGSALTPSPVLTPAAPASAAITAIDAAAAARERLLARLPKVTSAATLLLIHLLHTLTSPSTPSPVLSSNEPSPVVSSDEPSPVVSSDEPSPLVGSDEPSPVVGSDEPSPAGSSAELAAHPLQTPTVRRWLTALGSAPSRADRLLLTEYTHYLSLPTP